MSTEGTTGDGAGNVASVGVPTTFVNSAAEKRREKLLSLPKEELVAMLINQRSDAKAASKKKKKKQQRPFDITKFRTANVAIKYAYIGWEHHGLSIQKDAGNTVEEHLFNALRQLRLVAMSTEPTLKANGNERCGLQAESAYQRCGRTDVGVSALCQVSSLFMRVSDKSIGAEGDLSGVDLLDPSLDPDKLAQQHIDFARKLNQVLPPSIRVYGSCFVPDTFSARFDCSTRTYKYFFLKDTLDIDRMNEAAQFLVGEHDFRNFCKIDAANVLSFTRTVISISIDPVDENGSLYAFTIHGQAFLWHQVRCMVAVLFLVGYGREEPSVVETLLDLEKVPSKPIYTYASEIPLVLWDCEFTGVNFHYVPGVLERVQQDMCQQWQDLIIKAAVLRGMLGHVSALRMPQTDVDDVEMEDEDESPTKVTFSFPCALVPRHMRDYQTVPYVNLLDRPRGLRLEEMRRNLSTKKRKIYDGKIEAAREAFKRKKIPPPKQK